MSLCSTTTASPTVDSFLKSLLAKIKSSLPETRQRELAEEPSARDDCNALMEAVETGAGMESIRGILELGGDINIKTLLGQSVLHMAAK